MSKIDEIEGIFMKHGDVFVGPNSWVVDFYKYVNIRPLNKLGYADLSINASLFTEKYRHKIYLTDGYKDKMEYWIHGLLSSKNISFKIELVIIIV